MPIVAYDPFHSAAPRLIWLTMACLPVASATSFAEARRSITDGGSTMTRWARLGLMAGAALASGLAAAAPDDPVSAAFKLFREGRALSAVEQLHALAFRADGSVANDIAEPMWAQSFPSPNGLIATAPVERDRGGEPATPVEIAAVTAAKKRDAMPTIVGIARDRRIVILNEEHDAPEDRAFGLAVARALRPLGFTALAAETFTNDEDPARTDMAALAMRGYPIRRTGTYTADPVFGDFVRQALALGYKPVAYEETDGQRAKGGTDIASREEAEASNLSAEIARAPQVRFLIHVGYAHAAETPLGKGDKANLWIAGRLKAKTGIDPLTIDQTGLGAANASRSGSLLRGIAQRGVTRPVILFSGGEPLRVGQYRDAVDLQVVHPATRLVHGRPDWLATMGRHPVRPAPDLVPASGRALVQAFLAREGPDAVPVDQAVLEPRHPRWFMLPDRPVRFVVKETLPAQGPAAR